MDVWERWGLGRVKGGKVAVSMYWIERIHFQKGREKASELLS